MTSVRGLGPSDDSGLSVGDQHRYAMWDAAYVLGSLTWDDRREFEAHMSGCPACREAVAELSGVPALLSQLDRSDVAALNEETPELSPGLLPSLLATVKWRRRRSRLVTWSCSAAAAVVLAVGVFIGVAGHSRTTVPAQLPPQASVSAQPMAQVGTTELASTVSVTNERWGTLIDLNCICLAPAYANHDRLAMVVVGRDGSHTRLATWTAEPGHTAKPAGSISMPADRIAAVQVVSADGGQVLLERSL